MGEMLAMQAITSTKTLANPPTTEAACRIKIAEGTITLLKQANIRQETLPAK
jgi:hypothetical protein